MVCRDKRKMLYTCIILGLVILLSLVVRLGNYVWNVYLARKRLRGATEGERGAQPGFLNGAVQSFSIIIEIFIESGIFPLIPKKMVFHIWHFKNNFSEKMIDSVWFTLGASVAILLAWMVDRCGKRVIEERLARKGRVGEGYCWFTSKITHISVKRKDVKMSYQYF